MSIDALCDICRGRVISKDYIRDNPGLFPVYSSQTENDGILGWIDDYMYDGDFLTWTTDGANAGTVFLRRGKFNITNVCGLLRPKTDAIDIDYLYYALGSVTNKYVNKGMGNPKLMSNVMARIKVPVPNIEEQKRIANILHQFDSLCNNLVDGIPAEIEARNRQYAYYRDKILSFENIA